MNADAARMWGLMGANSDVQGGGFQLAESRVRLPARCSLASGMGMRLQHVTTPWPGERQSKPSTEGAVMRMDMDKRHGKDTTTGLGSAACTLFPSAHPSIQAPGKSGRAKQERHNFSRSVE